jgi:hypothetical protein
MQISTPDTRVEAGAEKRFFIEMLVKDIELLPAIVDLVDNSVDGARNVAGDGSLAGQWVNITVGGDRFVIADNSGGISADIARHYAFRFGRPQNFTGVKRSVGQFGVGMKRAIFKIGKDFRVESTYAGENPDAASRFSLKVNVDEWAQSADWSFTFDEIAEGLTIGPSSTAGTQITVERLHPSVSDDLSDPSILQLLKTELKVRHQESIQSGLEIRLNDELLAASRPALQSSDLLTPISKSFTVGLGDNRVDVKLFAGTVAPRRKPGVQDESDDGRAENFQDPGDAGWYFFCNDRLLLVADRTPLTGWGSAAAAYHPQYRNFRGYVYLSADDASLLPWNTTKTAVDRDSDIFRSVQSEMKIALVAVQSAINRAKSEKSRIEDNEDMPDIVRAFDESSDLPLTDLRESARMVVPPAPERTRPVVPAIKIQRIQYSVDRDRYKEVAAALEASSASEVGRLTFDYFYGEEID